MYQDTVEKLDAVGDQKVDHKMLRYFLQPMDRRYHREKMLELRYEIQLPFEGNGPSILHQKVHLYGAKYLHGANSGWKMFVGQVDRIWPNCRIDIGVSYGLLSYPTRHSADYFPNMDR